MRRLFLIGALALGAVALSWPAPALQRPAGQIVPGPTGTGATWFFDQKADSLGTIQQSYSYRYYIDANTTPIVLSATCTDAGPNAPLYPCSGQMSTVASGQHDYTLEVSCSVCNPPTAKALPITYSATGTNGLVAPTGLRMESSSGATIPPLASIVDGAGATWTQSATPPAACPPSVASNHPPSDCLPQMRNGTVLGLGAQILYKNAIVYVQGPSGTELHWWSYQGNNSWTDVGTGKP